MQRLEFPSDSPMSDFLDVRMSQLTRHHYIFGLGIFFKSLGLDGSIDKQSREFLAKAKKDKVWAQNGLKYFIRDKNNRAENGELAEGTVRNFYKPVKLFCDIHDVELSWRKITMMLPKRRKFANDRAPTLEEVQTVVEYPDRRIKPLVLVTCSSGIRIGAWQYLKWKHVEPLRRDDRIVAAKIIVYAGENEQYFSFITPEAFQAVQEWMDYRKKCGEDITGESWLMRTSWDASGPTFSTSAASPTKMTTGALKAFVKRVLKAQGLRTTLVARRHEFKTSHGFRKFFQTNCEPKMKSLCVKMLMGQETGLADSYYKPTVEELLEEYLKAVDNLTINRTELQQAEVVRNQQALAAELRTKDQEMQQLKESSLERDNTIQALQQELRSYHDITMKLADRTNELESSVKFFQKEVKKYAAEFGARHLTEEELKKIRESQEQAGSIPDSNNFED